LKVIYFEGNPPSLGMDTFALDNSVVYYLPGASGWGPTFGGLPTVLWNQQAQHPRVTLAGVSANGFGFTVTGVSNAVWVVEACTDLGHPAWASLGTCTLTNASGCFSDPDGMNYPARFYRLRSP
jgi:hypothetical protein